MKKKGNVSMDASEEDVTVISSLNIAHSHRDEPAKEGDPQERTLRSLPLTRQSKWFKNGMTSTVYWPSCGPYVPLFQKIPYGNDLRRPARGRGRFTFEIVNNFRKLLQPTEGKRYLLRM